MIIEKILIAGRWRSTKATLPIEDPSEGETIGTLAVSDASDVDEAVKAAQDAYAGAWGKDRRRVSRIGIEPCA